MFFLHSLVYDQYHVFLIKTGIQFSYVYWKRVPARCSVMTVKLYKQFTSLKFYWKLYNFVLNVAVTSFIKLYFRRTKYRKKIFVNEIYLNRLAEKQKGWGLPVWRRTSCTDSVYFKLKPWIYFETYWRFTF